MILPVGDAPNPRGFRPWVNWTLIAINVLVFLGLAVPLGYSVPAFDDPTFLAYMRYLSDVAPPGTPLESVGLQVTAYDLFIFKHGFRPSEPNVIDLVTALFLHGGALHLAGNLLFLWIYGDNVEHRLGRAAYLVAYLGCGVAATLAYTAFASDSPVPLVGASGAISGVLGFYFVFFPANHVRLLFLLPPFMMRSFLVSARLVLGAYIVLDNVVPFVLSSGSSGVAYGAHLGGFVGGAIVAIAVARLGHRLGAGQWAGVRSADATALRDAITQGDAKGAMAALDRSARQAVTALQPDEQIRLAAWLGDASRHAAALTLLRPLSSRRDGVGARAALLTGRLLLARRQPAAAYAHLVRAGRQQDDPAAAQVAQQLVAELLER